MPLPGAARAAKAAQERRSPCSSCAEHGEGLFRRLGDVETRLAVVENHINESSGFLKAVESSIKEIQAYFVKFKSDVDAKFKTWDEWKGDHSIRTGELMQQCKTTQETAEKTNATVNLILDKMSEQRGMVKAASWIGGKLMIVGSSVIAGVWWLYEHLDLFFKQ